MKPIVAVLLSISALVPAVLAWPDATADRSKARAEYPTPLCIVSGEHLKAGETKETIYHQEGQPDRLIRLCCNKCKARFEKNPDEFLKELDQAEAAKKARAKGGGKSDN
jgi:hypothetical protein